MRSGRPGLNKPITGMRSSRQVKLGELGNGTVVVEEPLKPRFDSKTMILIAAVTLLGAAAIVGIILAAGGSTSDGKGSASSGLVPTPEPTRTNFPTTIGTRRPTNYPTAFPTTSQPTGPTPPVASTGQPTRTPTPAPTPKPVGNCANPDAVCGCNFVQSQMADIWWIVDESGSVGSSNYVLMQNGIRDFVDGTDFGQNATRHGVIEFTDRVKDCENTGAGSCKNNLPPPGENNIIDMTDYATKEELIANMLSHYKAGYTDQRNALNVLGERLSLSKNALRPAAQLMIIFLTDGNPCTGSFCPNPENIAGSSLDPIPALLSLRAEYNFTFVFIPLIPSSGSQSLTLDLFDAAVDFDEPKTCSECLSPAEFVKFNRTTFSELGNLLQTSINIPLGPCIPAPSTRRRVLKDVEAGKFSPFHPDNNLRILP